MDSEALHEHRQEKDTFFKTSAYSPLTPEQQDAFDGLRYYEPNPDLDMVVTVERLPETTPFQMETTSGDVQQYRRFGRFSFEVEGQPVSLTIYAGAHGYFLPFADANAGGETYGAGRYLEPESLGDDRFHVDFNQAYSPYCAYGEPQSLSARAGREPIRWSCPITPAENRLSVAIRAGEMSPRGPWVDSEEPGDRGEW